MYAPDSELDITYCQEMHQIYSKRTVNTPGKFYFLMQFSPFKLTDSSMATSRRSYRSLTFEFASASSFAICVSLPTWSSDMSLH